MQKKMEMVVLGTLLGGACGLGFIGGLIFIAGPKSVLSAPPKITQSKGWQTYREARLGFTVARPAGWTVRTDSGSTVNVQSGSKHYYRNNQTGTVIGTAYSPSVDFTPLTER